MALCDTLRAPVRSGGESDLEAGATEGGVEHADGAAVGGGDGADERQPEPGAAGAAGPTLVEAGEALEDALAVGHGHAGAVVVDPNHGGAVPVPDAEADGGPGVAGSVVG